MSGNSSADRSPCSPRYTDAVPAIVRALDLIEHLQSVPAGLSLSQLSRAHGINPSSALAILRTLAHRGYVEHDATDGTYRLGPALERLADESTASQVVRQVAKSVSVLAQATICAAGPGRTVDRQRDALYALGLASRQLSALLLEASDDPGPVWHAEASGPLGRAELGRFLAGAWIATLSCVKENGYPYSVPVWYHWDSERFWVVPRTGAEWAHHVERNPCISLAISEPRPPLQRVLVEGRAELLTGPGSQERTRELTALMATRYLGSAATPYLEATSAQPSRAFSILPEKLVTWHGLAPHPRYQSVHQIRVND